MRNLLNVSLALSLAVPAFAQTTPAPAATGEKTVAVDVDLGHTLGPYKPITSWFGYDEGNYTTAPGGKKLLRELHDLSATPVYIRFHHLLTSGDGTPDLKWSSTGIYREDAQGKPVYNFTILDGMLDELKAAGVRPMLELGFMPEDLAATVPGKTRPYRVPYPDVLAGSSNNPPKDYAKWGELARVLTAHLVQRYGREAVLSWYFEVWNEPDISYWHATPQEYLRLYDFAVAGVRAALPGARVGGPATTGPSGRNAADFLTLFLHHVESEPSLADGKPIPIDFISFHAKGHPSFQGGDVTMSLSHELRDVDAGFGILSNFAKLHHLPVILSEADPEGCAACSAKVNPANGYRNGTLYPAYTAAAFKGIVELAGKHDTNLISMLSWSFEFEGKDYFEGFRTLSTNGVDKPVLNFFRMTGMMNGDRVEATSTGALSLDNLLQPGSRTEPDVDAMSTRGAHEAEVLLWNYSENEAAGQDAALNVRIRNLPANARQVKVEHFRIDATHSNAYTLWKSMGSPQKPTPEQYAQLQARAGLEMLDSPRSIAPEGGSVTLPTALPKESLSLLRLTW